MTPATVEFATVEEAYDYLLAKEEETLATLQGKKSASQSAIRRHDGIIRKVKSEWGRTAAGLAYLVECQLATWEETKYMKSIGKGDASRRLHIAQTGVSAVRRFSTRTDIDLVRGSRTKMALEGSYDFV